MAHVITTTHYPDGGCAQGEVSTDTVETLREENASLRRLVNELRNELSACYAHIEAHGREPWGSCP